MTRRLPLAIEALLAPAALLYRSLTEARNFAFEHGFKSVEDIGRPVISIGNITAGGTGKTPLVAHLAEGFTKHGVRVGIVSRGYGGTETGPARVPSDGASDTARRFGDEPAWLAARFPDIPMIIGRDRVAAAKHLLSQSDVELILADDAFQHRRLSRALDVVVLDASAPRWHYRALPLGRLREPFASLSRAQAIFITKANLASPEALQWIRTRIESECGNKALVYQAESYIKGFAPLSTPVFAPAVVPAIEFRSKKLFLVSAIGNPEAFAALIENDIGSEVKGHRKFADHHAYSSEDFTAIENEARSKGVDCIVVTEKDAVKFGGWKSPLPCWVTRLEIKTRTGLEDFYEAVDRVLL